MVLDWLSRSHRPPTVDELVAKGRYAQAAAVLRTQIEDRTPTLPEAMRKMLSPASPSLTTIPPAGAARRWRPSATRRKR